MIKVRRSIINLQWNIRTWRQCDQHKTPPWKTQMIQSFSHKHKINIMHFSRVNLSSFSIDVLGGHFNVEAHCICPMHIGSDYFQT